MQLIKGLILSSLLVISVCAGAATANEKILVVLSSESKMTLANGDEYETGYYLNEFGVPADMLMKAGYSLTIATPKGNVPVVDKRSVTPAYFGESEVEMQRIQAVVKRLLKPDDIQRLSDIIDSGLDEYAAVFIPGGHAPLIDLVKDPDLGVALRHFNQKQKPTAAICHGPIALLAAQNAPTEFENALIKGNKASAENWIYDDYKMTIFSTPEEQVFESSLNGREIVYYPADAMRLAGGQMQYAEKWQSNVVVDRELITGQNPFSDKALAEALISLLEKSN